MKPLESRFQVKPNSSTGVDAMMKIHEGHTRASASPPLCLTLVSDQKKLEPVTDPSLSIIRE